MKKSTLITTIAMIVVVVVALSTATYAWFTGTTKTQTEQTMTTQAASGWFLYGADITTPTSTSSYKGEATIAYSQSSEIQLNLLNSGLYAPAATLSNDLENAVGNDLAATYTDTQFFAAKQQGFGILNTAEITKPVAYDHAIGDTATTASNLNAIRIVNGNSTPSDCHLTILVYTSTGATTQEQLAGKGFSMYIATSEARAITTGYWYATELSSAGDAGGTATKTANSSVEKANVTYKGASDADSKTYKTVAVNKKVTFGTKEIPAGTMYYTIDIVLKNTMAAGSALNIVFYAWFDGWALDTTAEGGTLGVNLAFGGTETTAIESAA